MYNIIQIHIDRKEADDTIKGLVDTVHKQNNPAQPQNNSSQPETYTDSADQVFNIQQNPQEKKQPQQKPPVDDLLIEDCFEYDW